VPDQEADRLREPTALPFRRLSDDGLKAWQEVVEHGYEGLVAKDPASHYIGWRTLRWPKDKHRTTGKASAGLLQAVAPAK
jgi:ATP-dependent DNA ligase